VQAWEYRICRIWGAFVLSSAVGDQTETFATLEPKGNIGVALKGKEVKISEHFEALGAQGWELVAMTPMENTRMGGEWFYSTLVTIRAVFKRPKS
jgi:hypothetical protein